MTSNAVRLVSAAPPRPHRRRRHNARHYTAFTIVGLVALASMIPFGYLIAVSFTPASSGAAIGSLWPELFAQVPVLQYMLNSAIVSIGATVIVILISTMAGFGFAKLRYPGSSIGYGLVLAALAVPGAATILPNYLNLAHIGGINTYWAPILLYTAGGIPFAAILSTAYFAELPDEVVESAVMDGAGYGRIFGSIMAPMAVPAMATIGVLTFLGAWNDLLVGLLFLPDPALRTINVGVSALESLRLSNIDLALAGSLLSALPPLLAFVLFQRHLVSGITAGVVR